MSRRVQRRYWRLIGEGVVSVDAARAVGVADGTAGRWFREAGGVKPSFVVEPSGYRLSLVEREEIAIAHGQRQSVREIARALGRSASTVSRELRRSCVGRRGYRASVAQADADRLAKRPKQAKLVGNPRLRQEVERGLKRKHSPTLASEEYRCARSAHDRESEIAATLFLGEGPLMVWGCCQANLVSWPQPVPNGLQQGARSGSSALERESTPPTEEFICGRRARAPRASRGRQSRRPRERARRSRAPPP